MDGRPCRRGIDSVLSIILSLYILLSIGVPLLRLLRRIDHIHWRITEVGPLGHRGVR